MENNNSVLLEMKNICKSFPGVKALDNVSLTVKRGTVHALMGENGAGKSTLMKCLFGIYKMDAGEIYLDGEKIEVKDPDDAMNKGIAMVHQELQPIPERTVAENMYTGRYPTKKFGPIQVIDHKKMFEETAKWLDDVKMPYDPKAKLGTMSIAQMQSVEIAKAVSLNARVVILDEPTSALAKAEVEKLFAAIRKVKENDVIIIYISHKLAEIHEIADTVTVLRDAQYVGKKNIEEIDNAGMIAMMFGKTEIRKRPADVVPTDEPVMEVKHLTRAGWYEDISFTLYKGEVLGIAGVLGSGRTELLGGIFGSDPADSGEVIIEGKTYIRRTPAIMKNAGLGLTPEDRKTGLILKHSIESNLCYAGMKKTTINGWVESRKKRREMSERQVKALQIKLSSISAKASSMSGGNQQKVVVGNWLNNDPKIMIYDEPTRGIDVNAKQQIFEIMWNQAKQGNSSIFVSTELEELPGVCNRILVLRGGRITEELTTEKIDSMTTNDLYTLCMGGHSSEREN